MIKNNSNNLLCTACGGACCNRIPGSNNPSDFKDLSKEGLKKVLLEDGYQLDYWEGNPTNNKEYDNLTAYYIRPRTINSLNSLIDASWGGKCSFLTEKGCKLEFDNRPSECKDLIPNESFNCKGTGKYTKKENSIAWLPYNSILEEVVKEYLNKEE